MNSCHLVHHDVIILMCECYCFFRDHDTPFLPNTVSIDMISGMR